MTLIISNYNYVPSELISVISSRECLLYDQTTDSKIRMELIRLFPDNYIKSLHTGHNLSDYFKYIIDNYNTLPEVIFFIKGNIFKRHFESESFFDIFDRKSYFPLYSKPESSQNYKICGNLGSNLYYELNDPWYMQTKTARYFSSFDDFMAFIFVDYVPQRFVVFNPGACQIVTREQITRYPRQFWVNLHFVVSYTFFPAEAYIIERAMFYILMGGYTLSDQAIAALPSDGTLEGRMSKVVSDLEAYNSTLSRILRRIL